jgi:predicted nucleic acid-binding protein
VIVVVADTSPLNYLIQIGCDHVLPALYERVFVPSTVVEELRDPRAVEAVGAWLKAPPSWLVVEQVAETADARLARLDPGERQAIQLAQRAHADLLLMDERLARLRLRPTSMWLRLARCSVSCPHSVRAWSFYITSRSVTIFIDRPT